MEEIKKKMTIVVLTDRCDKAKAAFMLAISSALMDIEVNMFFTFFGARLLKKGFKPKLPSVYRFVTGIFESMLEKGGIEKLSKQIERARELGVKFYVCSACVNAKLMKKEQLIEGVEIIGMPTLIDMELESDLHMVIG